MLSWVIQHGSSLSIATGSILEGFGAFLMANRYLSVRGFHALIALVSALYRGSAAKDVAEITEISTESNIVTLQGLAFIIVGSFLHAAPYAGKLFD